MSVWTPNVRPFTGLENVFEWKKDYLEVMEKGGWGPAKVIFFESCLGGLALQWYQNDVSRFDKKTWPALSAAFDARWLPATVYATALFTRDFSALRSAAHHPWHSLRRRHHRVQPNRHVHHSLTITQPTEVYHVDFTPGSRYVRVTLPPLVIAPTPSTSLLRELVSCARKTIPQAAQSNSSDNIRITLPLPPAYYRRYPRDAGCRFRRGSVHATRTPRFFSRGAHGVGDPGLPGVRSGHSGGLT